MEEDANWGQVSRRGRRESSVTVWLWRSRGLVAGLAYGRRRRSAEPDDSGKGAAVMVRRSLVVNRRSVARRRSRRLAMEEVAQETAGSRN